MDKWSRVADQASEQHGLVSRAQLLKLGISETTISRLTNERGWVRMHPGVYRLPGHEASLDQRVLAAQLALPVDSTASSATAAALFGLRSPSDRIDLLVDEHDRCRAPAGVRLTRTRTLVQSDVTNVRGIRVATGCRMVIDYAGAALPAETRALLIDAVQRRLVRLAQISDRLQSIGPVRGRGVLRQLVWEMDKVRCDSVLEHKARQLIEDANLPAPHPGPYPVRAGRRTVHVDIAWPGQRVGIEVEGFAYHSSRADLERDQRRGNTLALAKWTVLRVGWGKIERGQDAFVRELQQLLGIAW